MTGLLVAVVLGQLAPSVFRGGDDGCPDGFSPTPGDACLATPTASNGRVVVYFHGMVPSPWKFRVKPELATLAHELLPRGYSLVAMRGERGLCDWSDDVRAWWCWPNGLRQLPSVSPVLARLDLALHETARVVKTKLAPPVVVGFSNGGFFTSLVASDSKLEVSGYVIAHGGPVVGQGFSVLRRRPVLLLGATGDTVQLPLMKLLAQMLEEDRWDPTFSLRDGQHEVTSDDARAVAEFAERLSR